MRVLLVSSGSGSRGGGEIFLEYLGGELADRGHEVVTWIPAHERMNELAAKCANFGRVVRSSYRNTYDRAARSLATCFDWRASRQVAREWEALKPDVVHVNKQNLEDGLDLLRATRHTAAPSICTIHLTQTARYLGARAAGLRDWIARDALSRYRSVIVAVQEGRRRALADFLGESARTRTVFNGVPTVHDPSASDLRKATRKALGLTDDHFLVLGVGRLVEQKRPMLFLKIAQELHRQNRSARFLWVGDGDLAPKWNEWIERERLKDVVSCAGWQPDARRFLLAGDLLLHVAEFEGLPLAIIEAMAAGLPCAVTRNFAGEIPELDEGSVLFVDDPTELSAAIRDRCALRRISAGGRRLAETAFSVRAMADSYERLYLEAGAA